MMTFALNSTACSDAGFRAETPSELVDEGVERGLPGTLIGVDGPGIEYAGAAGVADREADVELGSEDRFRIASNSKMFIGLVAAQLHVAGVLSLDETLGEYLAPELIARVANAETATVRQGLNHTSGIADYLDNEQFATDVLANPTRRLTDAQALAYAYDAEPLFSPGEGWGYSNTNYLLAALVIDAVTGEHHAVAIREGILDPLGMSATYYEFEESSDAPISHGYFAVDGGLQDTRSVNLGYGLGDGGLISNAADLLLFIRAPERRDARLGADALALVFDDLQDAGDFQYGLGVVLLERRGLTLTTHGGEVPGYSSGVYYHDESDTALVTFTNGTGPDLDGTKVAFVERALDLVFH